MRRGYKETEIGKIPVDWDVKNLSTFSDIIISSVDKIIKADEIPVPVCNYLHTYRNRKITSSTMFDNGSVTEEEYQKFLLLKYDIVITKDSEDPTDIAIPAYISDNIQNLVCGYHLAIIRTNNSVDSEFIARAIETPKYNKYFQNNANGATRFGLTIDVIKNATFPLPPLPEQKKIAEVLSSVDESIRATQALIEQAKVLKQGMLNRLLTKGIGHKKFKQTEIGEIPEEWEVKSLEEIACKKGLVRGPFGGAIKKECFVDSGYKIYEQQNAINADAMIGRYYIDESKYVELKRFEVKAGDFIISCSGTIGRICQIPKNFEKGIINQALLKITINNSICTDGYFLQYFRWDEFQKIIIESTQGGAMKNLIGMDKFRNTLLPIPSPNEQRKITNILISFDELENSNREYLKELIIIKTGLMQDLLSGKKRVV